MELNKKGPPTEFDFKWQIMISVTHEIQPEPIQPHTLSKFSLNDYPWNFKDNSYQPPTYCFSDCRPHVFFSGTALLRQPSYVNALCNSELKSVIISNIKMAISNFTGRKQRF